MHIPLITLGLITTWQKDDPRQYPAGFKITWEEGSRRARLQHNEGHERRTVGVYSMF
jgi:hypothetical protein